MYCYKAGKPYLSNSRAYKESSVKVPKLTPEVARQSDFLQQTNMSIAEEEFRVSTDCNFFYLKLLGSETCYVKIAA